ncbi:MAG: YIP1 family protein [Rhabdochlamydiaceae bacterium]|nr:YIP1 family protein [Rhabdochlamydiaceae bacterium]
MAELNIKPWFSIWIKPKQTVRAIIDFNVRYRFFILSVLYGLPTVLQTAQNLSLSSVLSMPAILIGCVILSPILGAIGLLLCTLFLTWTGRWIGGRASFLEMRCAVSWTNATNIVTVLIWAALIGRFKEILFFEGFVNMPMTTMDSAWLTACFFIQLVVAIWSFILLMYAISEVHRFSVWKSLLNIAMAFVVGVGISWIVAFILERVADLRV